ncbi:MAG: hypothetical protein LIO81_03680 [Clostridiales bacterium]|nr:hypothetical protein [Clostridiales bacterium]
MFKNRPRHAKPTMGYSLFVVAVFLFIVLGGYQILSAPMNIMFGMAWLFLFPACMYLGYTFDEINGAVLDQCRKSMTGVFIIISVGSVIAAWIACGCIPAIIYYGLGIVNPSYFLVATFMLCVVISTACGTSWGAAATAGMAMFAIGQSMGVPAAMTVGAIASGSLFGDMLSPLSDSANLAAISVGGDLMKHCKESAFIAVPAMIITAIIYTVMGMSYAGGTFDTAYIAEIRGSIGSLFHVGIVAFIPLLLLIVLLFKKVPAMFAMLISAICGGLIAVFYQGLPLQKMFTFMWSGYKIETDVAFISTLLNRGGMTSMANTAIMTLFTYGVIGSINKVGIMDPLVKPLVEKAKGILSLAVVTEVVAAIAVCFGNGGVAMLLTGTIMAPAYKEKKLDLLNLSKVSSALAVPWNAIIPWTTTSIYFMGLFDVTPMQWIPYFVFAFVMPIMALIFMAFHIREIPAQEETETNV